MLDRLLRKLPVATLLAGTSWLGLACAPVQADGPLFQRPHWLSPPCQCAPPPCGSPMPGYQPMVPSMPGTPATPQAQTPGSPQTPSTPQPQTQAPTAQTPSTQDTSGLGSQFASAVGGEDVAISAGNVGYIDSAIIRSQVRVRFDAAYDNNRPDRAEFFYPKCGCFGTPDAKGPRLPERMVDYQEVRTYVELALSNRLSGFVEVPIRAINPEFNDNATGISDIEFGFRYGLFACEDTALTFQLKIFAPTGDGDRGLGTEHWSVEPGLLFYYKMGDFTLEAEVRDRISLDGSDFAGNVLRYGVGVGYDLVKTHDVTITPVAEFVAWTMLDGRAFEAQRANMNDFSVSGDTIVNGKLGVRTTFGNSSIYAGYGRALTGDVWYKDVVRLEYRLSF